MLIAETVYDSGRIEFLKFATFCETTTVLWGSDSALGRVHAAHMYMAHSRKPSGKARPPHVESSGGSRKETSRRTKPDGGSGKKLWRKAQTEHLENHRIHFVHNHPKHGKLAHVVDNWARYVGFPMQYLLLVSVSYL